MEPLRRPTKRSLPFRIEYVELTARPCTAKLVRVDKQYVFFFFFQAEDGIRDLTVTGVQTCALPIYRLLDGAGRVPHRAGGGRDGGARVQGERGDHVDGPRGRVHRDPRERGPRREGRTGPCHTVLNRASNLADVADPGIFNANV